MKNNTSLPVRILILVLLVVSTFFMVSATSQRQPYKRSLYTHWVDADRDCQNTRTEVLIRDSFSVKLSKDGCKVLTGVWLDPYTGNLYTDPKALDVDHVVPLKNAHDSGAHSWSKEKRRQYANYMGYADHLLAVSAVENRRKGARGPDGYLPPNPAYLCSYIKIWSSIKVSWDLAVTDSERQVIFDMLQTCKRKIRR